MRTFSWTGNNQPLSESEFNELASTDKGLREMRYPFKYQRSDDKSLTGMYVNYPSYECPREFSKEQHERAIKIYNERRERALEKLNERGVLTFVGMGGEFTPTLPNGIGNYRIRCSFVDGKGETQFMEIHPLYNEKHSGCNERGFYGEHYFSSVNDRAELKRNELIKKYEAELGEHWWNQISRDQKEELDNLMFPKWEHVESSNNFTVDGILSYVNKKHKTNFTAIYYDNYFLNHDDITFNPSRC